MGERDLQLAEIRLLMDGVLSAGFITPKKSKELLKKLSASLSRFQQKELGQQVFLDHRNKQINEEIYYTV
ncbi:MAG: WYL domain-containing protein, partial [Clostridia bacterium]|nr:WYL domain-containing protein [Clostridia bacterium]